MAYTGQIVDVFVSSPGDVAEYRNLILSIIQSWNQRNGRTRKLFFNSLRWEDLVAPDMGMTGQDVINNQVGDEYDIFLGVMWAKFGTPTVKAESGTEEEFDRAVARHKSGEPLRVSFLFCTADVPFSKLDGTQFANVQKFKKKVQAEGCLTRDFVDEASLINAINLILDRFANTWADSYDGDDKKTKAHSALEAAISVEDIIENDESDAGLLDALEEYSEHNAEFIKILSEWTARLEIVQGETETATARLSDLTKFGKPEPSSIRVVISDITQEMDSFGRWCENKVLDLEKVMDKVSRDTLLILDLSRDFNEQVEDIRSARDSFAEFYESITSANEGILSYAEAVESAPRLDKMLNRANRKVVEVHRRLAEKNRLLQENIALCISDLDDRLK